MLHRDISHNNIMIDVEADDVKGLLLDFDACSFREAIARNRGKRWGRVVSTFHDDAHTPYLICCTQGTEAYHSILTLYYKDKPKEVADDLESIIYVFVFFALRFAWHTASPVGWGKTTRDQARINANNSFLRTETSSFFGSLGEYKRSCAITDDIYPVSLRDRESLLHAILEDLYSLLREHLLAIGTKFGARYGEAVPQPAPKAAPSRPRYYNFDRLLSRHERRSPSPEEKARRLEEERKEREAVKQREAAEAARRAAAQCLLDTHDAMLAVLEELVEHVRKSLKGVPLVDAGSDRTQDQFLGLGGAVGEDWSEPRKRVVPVAPKATVSEELPQPPVKRKAEESPAVAHGTRQAKKRRGEDV